MKHSVQLSMPYLRASLIVAAEKDIRYYLNGVFCEIRQREVRLVATDGHRLSILRRENAENQPDNEPASLIIPRDVIKGAKGMKARGDELDVVLHYDAENPLAECKLADLVDGGARLFKPIDGKLPDYDRIIPRTVAGHWKDDKGAELACNPYYLADFADLVRAALDRGKKDRAIFPEYHGNGAGGAAVLCPGFPDFFGVIMPMRTTAAPFELPAWIAGAEPEQQRKAA